MRFRAMLRIARRNAAYDRKKTLLYLLGTTAVMTLLAFLLSGAHVMLTYFEERKRTMYGDYHVLVLHGDRERVAEAAGDDLASAGVIWVFGRFEMPRAQGPSLKGRLGAFDADAQALARMEFFSGRAPQGPGEIALEQGLYLRLLQGRASVGSVEVAVTGDDGETATKAYTITGVYRNISDVWPVYSLDFALPSAITATEGAGQADTAVLVRFRDGLDAAGCYQRLSEKAVGACIVNEANLPIYGAYDQNEMYVARFRQMALTIALLLLFALFVCAMQSARAMLQARSRQYDIIRSLGGKRRDILCLSALETARAWLLAAPAALAVGCGLSWVAVWAGDRALGADVPFFVSGVAALAVLAVSLAVASAAWGLSVRKPRKRAPGKNRKKRLAVYMVRRAALGGRRGFHAAALGMAAACACFLMLPYFTGYLLTSVVDSGAYQDMRGDFIAMRGGAGYSTHLHIPDRMTTEVGLEYADIQRLRQLPEVEFVTYSYQEDYLKLIVDDPAMLDIDAVFASLISRSPMFSPQYKKQIEQEKLDNGYEKDGKPQDLAFCTLSGVDAGRLEALRGQLTDGSLDMEKLTSGRGVLAIDVSDVEGDEGVFPAGKTVTLSQLTEDRLDPTKANRADIAPEVVGTVRLTREEVKQYFGHTYADWLLDGLGIRFLWGAESFAKSDLAVTVGYVSATLRDPYDYDEVQAFMDDIEAQAPGILAISRPVAAQMRRGLSAIIDTGTAIVSLSMFLAGLLSLGLALYANMLKRGRERGILKALGAFGGLLARLYMESGAGIGLAYALIAVILAVAAYFAIVMTNTGSLQEFLTYAQSSGLWNRSLLCVIAQTLSGGAVGALLFRRSDKGVNEAIRYE